MVRALIALIGVFAFAACTPMMNAPSRSIALGQGDIIATSPAGYCVDDVSSRPDGDFAILAPCATLGADTAAPSLIGFATVQVGPADSGNVAEDELALRDYLITEDGARLLSQTGDAEAVDILSTQAFDSQVMIHFTDAGPPPVAGLQGEEWRAFTNINGRLVTIGVRGLAVSPLREGPGATLLKLVLAGVQATVTAEQGTLPDV